MKMFVFNYMKSLKDYSDGHLVVMAEDKEEMMEVVKERSLSNEARLSGTSRVTPKVYQEVKRIMNGECEDYRKPDVIEKPAAVAFTGSA